MMDVSARTTTTAWHSRPTTRTTIYTLVIVPGTVEVAGGITRVTGRVSRANLAGTNGIRWAPSLTAE